MDFSQHLFSLLDLTRLNDNDDESVIAKLCEEAMTIHVAAVCVQPPFVKQAVSLLSDTTIQIAAVANFPAGADSLNLVLQSMEHSLENGADEIDVVFPYTRYLAGEKVSARDFIKECKKICEKNILKVILETGALQDPDMILAASRDVIAAGADFLKTSTGKIAIGATPDAVRIMMAVIHQENPMVGIKVSGRVRTKTQALEYLSIAENEMGAEWVTPRHFRFGVSQIPA